MEQKKYPVEHFNTWSRMLYEIHKNISQRTQLFFQIPFRGYTSTST